MCCFSPVSAPLGLIGRLFKRAPPPLHVAGTRIFARMVSAAEQALIYSMRLTVGGEVAMLLPIPVVPRSGDHAVTFVDLQGYPRLFDDLAKGFEADVGMLAFGAPRGGFLARPKLVVYDVGSFVASYVPSRGDFDRLDPRFRLPDSVWAAMGRYDDWGFAVFQLKPGKEKQIHPMAFRFQTREPGRLFFPTVHVHDGKYHPTAAFDHDLYYQHPSVARPPEALGAYLVADIKSTSPARDFVRIADVAGLIEGNARVGWRPLHGERRNEDIWIDDTKYDSRAA